MNQDKIDHINYAHSEEITYWKKEALGRFLTESEEKELIDLAPSRVSLICKVKSVKTVIVDKIFFYLKSKYSSHITHPSKELSFEAIIGYLKSFSKSIKEDENMSMKHKYLIGGWTLMASKVYRRENLSCRFENWLYCLRKLKKQASYNYYLFQLASVAPKLMNCRVNTTYFVKNHKILLKYFDESETQTLWKHVLSCTCEECIFYFGEPTTV